jgi:hypothetical protein
MPAPTTITVVQAPPTGGSFRGLASGVVAHRDGLWSGGGGRGGRGHGVGHLGLGGEGFLSFSIATPTGEGVTTPMTFTRSRRCVMVENLNLY